MSDGKRQLDRRQFLALGGAAAAAVAAGGYAVTRRASADASTVLRSYNAGTVTKGLVRYRSRPDLIAPHVTIDTPREGAHGALVVTEVHDGDSQSGPLLINQDGNIVWFLPLSPQPSSEHRAFNVQVTEYQGKPVLAWFQGAVVAGHGQGSYLIFDESYNQIAEVQGQNGLQGDLHELVLTPQGTALFTAYGMAETTLDINGTSQSVSYWYGVVQEVDVASGKLLFEWRSDDHVPLSDSYIAPTVLLGGSWDYFHINAISIDPTDGNLVISSRNTWACYKVDRGTGDVIWQLGGKNNDFSMGPGTGFAFQHDVKLHPGGLMSIFDNEGGPPQQASQSRGLLLNVNEADRSVTLKQAFTHRPPVYSPALGSVQPLSGGRWFMGWGRSTYFTEYDRNGKVRFDGHLSGNGSSYRAFLQDWHGTPTVPPDIAVTRHGGGSTVFASWNGATALARWIVHGGTSPHTLAPLGNAESVGFETGITLPSAPAYVSVSACNAAGHVLATSEPIQVP